MKNIEKDGQDTRRTWEEAVEWLRRQPDQASLVRDCYYDDPLTGAAQRFFDSAEWKAVRTLLPPTDGCALDLGAGRGIGSYALARDGWRVIASEPDPSRLVGAGAIRDLAEASGLAIRVVQGRAERLPFRDRTFDLVYGRQVLHHAADLNGLCREVTRVLKPGGRFVATREHVISRPEDLDAFLAAHPLHRFYGGENAFLLPQYVQALRSSGLQVAQVLGPFDAAVNYAPMTHDQWREACTQPLRRILGSRATRFLTAEERRWGRWLLARLAALRSARTDTPGRLYSFVAEKPGDETGC